VKCVPRLRDVQPPVDAALVLTSPAVTDQVVRDCAEAGVSSVWLYRAVGAGAVSAEAVRFCESNGIRVIAGECPFMFLPGTGLIHRVHGFFRKLAGRYPR
jgi:acyl-CoA synthetase (NDP forming)